MRTGSHVEGQVSTIPANEKVRKYVAEQIKAGNKDMKVMLEHARKLDASLADFGSNVQKFNAAIYRKVRNDLIAAGEIELPSGTGSNGSSSRASDSPRTGSSRSQATNGRHFRLLLTNYASDRTKEGEKPDLFTLYAKFDPRAERFRNVLEEFGQRVDHAEGVEGALALVAAIDDSEHALERMFS